MSWADAYDRRYGKTLLVVAAIIVVFAVIAQIERKVIKPKASATGSLATTGQTESSSPPRTSRSKIESVLPTSDQPGAAKLDRSPPTLRTSGWPDYEISGVRKQIDAIAKLVGNQEGENHVTAKLEREPTNLHDPNAVRVTISDVHVGYVRMDQAPEWHPLLDAVAEAGATATAHSRLWYSPNYNGHRSVSVRLDVAEPALAWPINARRLPRGAKIWPPGGAPLVELHAPGQADKRVTVTFDDQLVGHVTAQTTKFALPVLASAADNDARVFAHATAKGSSTASEIKLRIERPENLTAKQMRTLTG